VCALGLADRLVAVTHECDFPPEATRLPGITRSTLDDGTRRSRDIHTHITTALHGGSSIYRLDQDLLERLAPDLVLTQELGDVSPSLTTHNAARRPAPTSRRSAPAERRIMFLILFAVLVVVWLLAWVAFKVASGLIHLLLIIALVSLILHFVRGRGAKV
jgi:Flp pilus assembly protein TadB